MPDAPISASPRLDYAPAPPKRRKWIVRSICIVLIVIITVVSIRWGPATFRKAQILYWQRQCLNYSALPDQIVYDEDPASAARLQAIDSEHAQYKFNRQFFSNRRTTPVNATVYQPKCVAAFRALAMQSARPLLRQGGATLFVGERRSAAGHRRLVCVLYIPGSGMDPVGIYQNLNCFDLVYEPATLSKQLVAAPRQWPYNGPIGYARHDPWMRIYAGQPDPNDPSHFTIRYQMWGRTDVIDGLLMDDDTVQLKPRKLPLDDDSD